VTVPGLIPLLLIPSLLGIAVALFLTAQLRALRRSIRSRYRGESDRLQTFMANSPEGIWRVDPQGITIEVNRAMADMLGLRPEDLVGRPFRDFISPASLPAAEEAFARGLSGEATQFETTLVRNAGGDLHLLITTHPVLDRKGNVVEGFGMVRDITARHRIESERRQTLSLLEAALESTADGLLIVDREGRIVRFNERFARMWQIPADILQSGDDDRALASVLSQLQEPEDFLSRVRKLYATPDAESFDTLRFRDGRVFERYSLPQRLGGQVVGRVWSFRDVTDRERAELDRRLAAEREATIAINLDTALFTISFDADGRVRRYEHLSRGAEALYGIPAREIEQDPQFWFRRIHPEDLESIVLPARDKLLRLQPVSIEVRYEASKGIWRWHRSRLTPRLEDDGTISVDGIETDVTDRVTLEEQFRHAQKMEAVGQLAGGVAHDFNNILTAVIGYADFLLARTPKTDASRPGLEEIRKGGERAAALTRQLLAFSRRAATQPRVVDLNAAIRNLEPMVRRLMGERIRFDLELDPAIGCVRVDPTQLEQVIVNLAVNARDAMPQGGTVSVRTDRVPAAEWKGTNSSEGEALPGVRLRVVDTGIGIPASVLEHIFEPFFTTKDPGRGTGLGLATVYGIVRQHGGRVQARSELKCGTEIEIILPELGAETVPPDQDAVPSEIPSGTETVLLVEDDPSLLMLAREALSELGYRILSAPNAREGLRILEQTGDLVQILVTDVAMPGMSGRELAERAREVRPGLPTLFVSGFTDDEHVVQAARGDSIPFLAKPYTSYQLARKLREVLDAPVVLAGSAGHVAR
jgi:two-component system cell cycle sensor histidine kinase/response regulator CckA